MNKLSDYIPLIVIVVSLFFTIIGKMRKQSDITQETMLPGKKPEELIGREKTPQTLADSYRKIVENKPKKQIIQRPLTEVEKEIRSFSPTPAVLDSEEEDNSPFTFEEEDLSKAIIYSEIIHRKEW